MHPDAATKTDQTRSPSMAAFGVVLAAPSFVAWVGSGQLPHLLGAVAFAAITPCWYFLPISWSGPFREQLMRRPERFPKWVQVSTALGMVALFTSVALRWLA